MIRRGTCGDGEKAPCVNKMCVLRWNLEHISFASHLMRVRSVMSFLLFRRLSFFSIQLRMKCGLACVPSVFCGYCERIKWKICDNSMQARSEHAFLLSIYVTSAAWGTRHNRKIFHWVWVMFLVHIGRDVASYSFSLANGKLQNRCDFIWSTWWPVRTVQTAHDLKSTQIKLLLRKFHFRNRRRTEIASHVQIRNWQLTILKVYWFIFLLRLSFGPKIHISWAPTINGNSNTPDSK